jgi:hypothetical protein
MSARIFYRFFWEGRIGQVSSKSLTPAPANVVCGNMRYAIWLALLVTPFLSQSCVVEAPQNLRWYSTCGDPVCRDNGYRAHPGISSCTSAQIAGAPCNNASLQCDPKSPCNNLLICSASDPTLNPGGCPISQRSLKKDIRYVTDDNLDRYHHDMMQMKLANYHYNWENAAQATHLGIIIEDIDNPENPAISTGRQTIDLYGYTSMAIAAIQAQNKEIEALKYELKLLKKQIQNRQ